MLQVSLHSVGAISLFFVWPANIGTFFPTEVVRVNNNKFAGEIPSSLYRSTTLKKLYTGDNEFVGTIKTEIGQMISLEELSLGPSWMDGPLPAELFTLPKILTLRLADSSFSGPLTEVGFGNLSDTIAQLWLQNNDFSGPIPILALQNSTNLQRLRLDGNSLTGAITPLLCESRGFTPGQLVELRVDCSITCPEGCCQGHEEC